MSKVQTAPARPAAAGKASTTATVNERVPFILLGVLLLLVAFIRSKFVDIPFERDEGAYSYYGRLLLEGYIPYKDFYEQKFPGLFYFYAFMVAVFGDNVKGLHIGFTILNIASIVMIFFAVRRLFSAWPAIVSAITFAIVSLTANLSGFTVQAEHGVAFFSSLGILLYSIASTRKSALTYFFMGLAMGAAFMTKTTGLFIMLWGGAIIILDHLFLRPRDLRAFIRNLLLYMAGATLVLAVLFLLVWMKGSFEEMIYWTYDIPKNYVSKVPFKEGVTYFGYSRDAILNNHRIFWYHGMFALGIILIKKISWQIKAFTVSLAAFSSLMIIPGFFFYGHYWIQLVPGLSVLAGVTFYAVMRLTESSKANQPKIVYGYAGIFIFLTLMHLNKLKDYYFNPNYDIVLRTVYGNNPFPETMEIAKYLNANMKKGDQVIFMGSEPQIYFYTRSKCPTRHAYFSAVVESVPQHKEWQREYSADVEKARPRFFVFARHSVSLLVQPNTDKYIFDWANEYISKNYNLTGVVDMPDGSMTSTYVWGKDAQTYSPKGQNVLFVFERKS